MSTINLHNYEAFLLDYHEGNLSPNEVAELLIFLETNPQLNESLEPMDFNSLNSSDSYGISFKNELKNLSGLQSINENTADDYFIGFYENELSATEHNSLKEFLLKNPNRNRDFELYGKVILNKNEFIQFKNKKELKKPVVIKFPVYFEYLAYAASVLLLIFAGNFYLNISNLNTPSNSESNQMNLATNNSIELHHSHTTYPLHKTISKIEIEKRQSNLNSNSYIENNQNVAENVELEPNNLIIDSLVNPIEAPSKNRRIALVEVKESKPVFRSEPEKTPQNEKENSKRTFKAHEFIAYKLFNNSKSEITKDSTNNKSVIQEVSEEIASLIGMDMDIVKNESGEVSNYSFHIGSFGISRKRGKN